MPSTVGDVILIRVLHADLFPQNRTSDLGE
jgi:hypothetical protein